MLQESKKTRDSCESFLKIENDYSVAGAMAFSLLAR